ncbi:MAG: hypothetical protein H0T73_09900 [Ardenticatenales bacterium]|nr:hypothetical protein [Ardenticatenales bacterium]
MSNARAPRRAFLALALSLFLFALAMSLLALPSTIQAQTVPEKPVVAHVAFDEKADLQWITDHGYDVWAVEQKERYAVVALSPAEWRTLAAAGYTLSIDEAHTARMQRSGPDAFYGGYLNAEELYAFLDETVTTHPTITQLVDYGDSWEKVTPGGNAGYDLQVLRITNRAISGTVPAPGLAYRPDITITKPLFFLMSNIHSREITTPEMGRRFIALLTEGYGSDPDVTWLVDNHEIWIVLTANPDGYKIVENSGNGLLYHRKNTNITNGIGCTFPSSSSNHYGVDLNRNASFRWGGTGSSDKPCDATYHGPSAASEPEEQALESLMSGLFNDQRGPLTDDMAPLDTSGLMISLHSYSDLVLWPWGWTDRRNANFAQLAQLGSKFSSYNGYTAQQSIALYPTTGTTDDWAYGTLGIASYTFEIGPGDWADPCSDFFPPYECQDMFWELNGPALLYAAKSARAPYQLPSGPDTLSVTVSAPFVMSGSSMVITAQISDTSNGNQPVAEARYWLDTPEWNAGTAIPMSATDGTFDSPTEQVQATLNTSGLQLGRHTSFIQGRDTSGHWGPVTAAFLEVSETNETLLLPLLRH